MGRIGRAKGRLASFHFWDQLKRDSLQQTHNQGYCLLFLIVSKDSPLVLFNRHWVLVHPVVSEAKHKARLRVLERCRVISKNSSSVPVKGVGGWKGKNSVSLKNRVINLPPRQLDSATI